MLRALLLVAVATPLAAQTDLTCPFRGTAEAVRARPSALDSLSFAIGSGEVKVCFGRPNARGRTMIGGDAVPYGRIWRTGANETTKIRTTVPLVIAGIAVPAGTYAIYTVPGETEWQVVVNRAWEQWGHERFYTAEVEAQDVARTTVPVERLADHVETFTIRTERTSGGVTLILEWEHTRIRVPLAAGSSSE